MGLVMNSRLLIILLFGLQVAFPTKSMAASSSPYLTEDEDRLAQMEVFVDGQKRVPTFFAVEINTLFTEKLITGEQEVVDDTEWVIQPNDDKRDPHTPFFSATFVYGFDEGDELLGRSATCSRWKDDVSFCTIECSGGYFDLTRGTEEYPEHVILRLRAFKSYLQQPPEGKRNMSIRIGSRGKTSSEESPGLETCDIRGRTEIRVPEGSEYFRIKLDAYKEN